jgi:DNA primase
MTERGEIFEIDRREVKITRPEKVLFPDDGITKRDLIEYSQRIASRILRICEGARSCWSAIRTASTQQELSRQAPQRVAKVARNL